MNIYVLPTSELGMNDKLFDQPLSNTGGVSHLPFLDGLRDAAEPFGHEAHTADFWSKKTSKPDDILVVQNHPGETVLWRMLYYVKRFRAKGGFILARRKFVYENYRYFKRRVLVQAESPMVMPYVYRHLEAVKRSGMYHRIMLTSKGWGDYDYFNPYDYRDHDIVSPHFNAPKNKFLILMNSNARPNSFAKELYGERLRAIRYFSGIPGFDLYGPGWDRTPRHPRYLHYGKYARRVWRGRVDDKLATMSRYRFAICYENASYPGYASEKIYDALAVGTIPVYLGATDIETFIPGDCFVDFRKFSGYADLHAHLSSFTEAEAAGYRRNILRFLKDSSNMRGIQTLVRQIVG